MYSDLSPIVELSSEFRSDTRSGFEGKSVAELKANVEMCCSLQPTVNTVITCATLAQQFSDLSHDVSKTCDQLVHEQHLQHQVSQTDVLSRAKICIVYFSDATDP